MKIREKGIVQLHKLPVQPEALKRRKKNEYDFLSSFHKLPSNEVPEGIFCNLCT